MLLGNPGSGKTTVAKIIEEITGAKRLTSDEERFKRFSRPSFSPEEHDSLYSQLDKETANLLTVGKSVIYDANLNRYTHRADKYKICDRIGAKAVLIWLNTDRELSKHRSTDKQRQHLWPDGETPRDMFERIANLIETPRPNENPIIFDGTNNLTKSVVTEALLKRGLKFYQNNHDSIVAF